MAMGRRLGTRIGMANSYQEPFREGYPNRVLISTKRVPESMSQNCAFLEVQK